MDDETQAHQAESPGSKDCVEAPAEHGVVDEAAEARLVRKLDLHIIWLVMLLYLLSFLDRVNIGNARLFGLEDDLAMHGTMYQTAVSLLFATYVATELPSNLVIKKVGPSRWIAFITTGWGAVATLTGVCQSYAGLVACRLVLGALEGGLFPGLAVYLTLFYSNRELALRVGYLFVSAALAGACGGLLAYAIGNMDGVAGLRAWRWIMIIEGLPTFVLGVATWWLLADEPDAAAYLTPADKALMRARRRRLQLGETDSGREQHWADVKKGLADWKIAAFAVGQFGSDTILYGYSTFLPTIIQGIDPGFSAVRVQLLTIPCYAVGAVAYLVVAHLSDRQQRRGLYTVAFGLVSIAGYAMLIGGTSSRLRYAGCFLVALGLYVVVGLPLAWLPANNPRYGKRTTATGLQLTVGNCAGIASPFLYPASDGPRYLMGNGVTLGLAAMACTVFAGMSLYFGARNRRRLAGKEDANVAGLTDDQVAELGDESPRFLFTK